MAVESVDEMLDKFKSRQDMHAKHPKDLMEPISVPEQPVAINKNNNMFSDACCEDIEDDEICVTRGMDANNNSNISFGIITVSDRAFNGVYEDVPKHHHERNHRDIFSNNRSKVQSFKGYKVVPDEKDEIAKAIVYMSDELNCDVILTTGGTGLAKRDVTLEALSDHVEKRA